MFGGLMVCWIYGLLDWCLLDWCLLDLWFVSVIVYILFTNKQLNWCSRNICGTWLAPNHLWDLACSPIKFGTWCAPKLYVGPGVLSNCMWDLVCSQVVCGTWCAPKLYVGPGVLPSCMWDLRAPKLYVGPTCSQVVCGTWRAPRLYVVYSQIIVIFNWDHGVVWKIFSIGLFLVKHPTPPPPFLPSILLHPPLLT